jgi:hypothetical protein
MTTKGVVAALHSAGKAKGHKKLAIILAAALKEKAMVELRQK